MDMSKQKERHGGRLFCRCEKYKKGVQTSRQLWRLQKVVSRRVCPCAFQRGSLTLETSIVLPFLLCAVTAMLYVFVMTGFQAEENLTGRAPQKNVRKILDVIIFFCFVPSWQ